jgi:hypothetical protein
MTIARKNALRMKIVKKNAASRMTIAKGQGGNRYKNASRCGGNLTNCSDALLARLRDVRPEQFLGAGRGLFGDALALP